MPSEILLTQDPQQTLSDFLSKKDYSKILLIVDENTEKHCLPVFDPSFLQSVNICLIRSGEEHKTLSTCSDIWQTMTTLELDRKAVVINIGGGVIGDMGGFCAATYKRGIDFIQIPTTLLSQVDASVGGKLGIDFSHFKNHIGVFKEPEAVIISSLFLNTLNKRELRSGFAEVIKHALIADATAWNKLKTQSLDAQNWNEVIPHSVQIKYNITIQDPTEKALRKVLNFGHTLGHAVESYFLEKGNRILHGEAIAIGMITESFIAAEKGFITQEACEEISDYLLSIYGYVIVPAYALDEIIGLTMQDKKNEQGQVLFSLLEKVGQANYNIAVDTALMKKSFTYYNSLNG
jgi:3-dehydroquinate synthase